MRNRIPTLALVAAMAAATFVALPPTANAQHYGHGFGHGYGHGYGHGFGHGFGHGLGGSAFYGPESYRSNDGSVRISKEFRNDAQVYVDGAHVGVVDDFDGIFQRLRLSPGRYEIEIEGDRTFRQQIFVSRGRTYKVRLGIEPNAAAELTSGTEASSRAGRTGYAADRFDSGAIRIQVKPNEDKAQVYVDGAHAGVVDDFDGVFQRLNLPTGRHDVEIRLAGHRTFRQQVFVSPRRTYKLRHQLEPLAEKMTAKEFQPHES